MINDLKKGHHGWICPKCGAVHAPWVDSCLCSKRAPYPYWPGTQFPFTVTCKSYD